MTLGFYLGLAVGIPFGMLVAKLPWRDARAVDLTPSLPVAVCKPAAWRRGDWRIDRNLDRLGEPTTYVTRRHK